MNAPDPRKVQGREDLAEFVRGLAKDFRLQPESWENSDLGNFLEAMGAWVDDMDGYYSNRCESVPAKPDLSTIAEILAAARAYE